MESQIKTIDAHSDLQMYIHRNAQTYAHTDVRTGALGHAEAYAPKHEQRHRHTKAHLQLHI